MGHTGVRRRARAVERLFSSEIFLHGALVADLARVPHVTTDEILGVEPPKDTGPLAERRIVRRIQDIERLPRRKKEILLSTIDSFLRGATASR